MGRAKRGIAKFTVGCWWNGQVVCETEMLCAVRKKDRAA